MEKEATTQENKDWAEMSDGEEPEADNNEQEMQVKKEKKKKIPQAKKGFKNDRGDYVVTSIFVPDLRGGVNGEKKEKAYDSDSDSDTEYDDEDDTKEVKKVEEEKKGKSF